MNKVCALIIISGHIVHIVDLNYMVKGKSILIPVSNFVSVLSILGDDDIEALKARISVSEFKFKLLL